MKAGSPPEEAGFDVAQAMVDESAPVEDGADNGGQDLTVKKNSNPFEDDDDEDEDEEKPPRYGQLLVVICILSLPCPYRIEIWCLLHYRLRFALSLNLF